MLYHTNDYMISFLMVDAGGEFNSSCANDALLEGVKEKQTVHSLSKGIVVLSNYVM